MDTSLKEPIEPALRTLSATRQRQIAVLLADLMVPFGDLGNLTEQPLSVLVADLRQTNELFEVDRVRRALWDSPALHQAEEPSGPEWYALGAVVAWIYAADSLCTAPSDGVVSTNARVGDVLDQAETDLAISGLCDQVDDAVRAALIGEDEKLVGLLPTMEEVARQIRDHT